MRNWDQLNRRGVLKFGAMIAAAAMGASALSPWLSRAARAAEAGGPARKKILFFTKSGGFEHDVISHKSDASKLGPAEQLLTDLGAKNGFDVTCSKDGGLFSQPSISGYDAYVFYTTGNLTEMGVDKQPPMTAAGKDQFLQSIKDGKGFIGLHSATDTFHSATHPPRELIRDLDDAGHDAFDPYIQMIGGEFITHGSPQVSVLRCADPKFPGASGFNNASFSEEWYSLKNFAPDLHVILVQDPANMKGPMYVRSPFPETWARLHGNGRVFYTSMGHRLDVWQKAEFQSLVLGAMNWATGRVDVAVPPNIKEVTPQADPKQFPAG